MNKNFARLGELATYVERSHGAFGEPEHYERLDVNEYAQAIVLECANLISGEPFGHTEAAEFLKKHFDVK